MLQGEEMNETETKNRTHPSPSMAASARGCGAAKRAESGGDARHKLSVCNQKVSVSCGGVMQRGLFSQSPWYWAFGARAHVARGCVNLHSFK